MQRSALHGVMEEVGWARSVLAYVADADRHLGAAAPLTLIDGHLRREEYPDEPVEVEVVDVDDAEARKLLLSLDPLAALAGQDDGALRELLAVTEAADEVVNAFWAGLAKEEKLPGPESAPDGPGRPGRGGDGPEVPEQYLVVITCRDERQQGEVYAACRRQGWKAKAVSA
ncbi:MAG: hypothetical protein ACRC33_02765 [Gemmataceae bacterium]